MGVHLSWPATAVWRLLHAAVLSCSSLQEAGVTVCALVSWLTSISKWLAPQGVAGSQGMKRHGAWGERTELDLVPFTGVGQGHSNLGGGGVPIPAPDPKAIQHIFLWDMGQTFGEGTKKAEA